MAGFNETSQKLSSRRRKNLQLQTVASNVMSKAAQAVFIRSAAEALQIETRQIKITFIISFTGGVEVDYTVSYFTAPFPTANDIQNALVQGGSFLRLLKSAASNTSASLGQAFVNVISSVPTVTEIIGVLPPSQAPSMQPVLTVVTSSPTFTPTSRSTTGTASTGNSSQGGASNNNLAIIIPVVVIGVLACLAAGLAYWFCFRRTESPPVDPDVSSNSIERPRSWIIRALSFDREAPPARTGDPDLVDWPDALFDTKIPEAPPRQESIFSRYRIS